VNQMRQENIKTRKLKVALEVESAAREKLRRDLLKEVISKMYRETLKVERERLREERIFAENIESIDSSISIKGEFPLVE
jgi:hypothetical protein